MKYLSFLPLALLLMGYQSAQSSETQKEPQTQTDINPPVVETWQKQLEFARQVTTSHQMPVTLTGYTYRGKIESPEQIKELLKELFTDSTYVVKYPGAAQCEIVPLANIKEEAKKKGTTVPYQYLMEELSKSLKVGMDIIDVEWNYRGKKISSIAIASKEKKGILYDHIGNALIIPGTEKSQVSTGYTAH